MPKVRSFNHHRDDCDKGNDFAGMDVGQMDSQRKSHTSAYSRTSSAALSASTVTCSCYARAALCPACASHHR